MDRRLVAGRGPRRPPGRRRLLPFLSSAGCPSAPRGGPGRGAAAALGGASRASSLLLLLLVPPPRLAAVAPRRPPADPERPRLAPRAPPAGLAPGVAWAAGALRLCRRRAAALAPPRRELSLSAGSLQLEHRRDLEHKKRDFTSCGNKKLYFDTHALVCLLEENGFTTQQAEITVSALVKITDANMDIVYKDMVTKMQQEVTVQQIMSQIANVKKDMIILEKSEFSALRAENEKINVELHRLKQQIMDEVIKVRTDTKLDFNLEKSRVKELYSLNERKLLEMRTEMVALHAQQDRAVTQTDRKIDTEVAGLKTMLESHKLDNIKYLAVAFVTMSGGQSTKTPLSWTSELANICQVPQLRSQVQEERLDSNQTSCWNLSRNTLKIKILSHREHVPAWVVPSSARAFTSVAAFSDMSSPLVFQPPPSLPLPVN